MIMQHTIDTPWTLFIEILSAEFTTKTGFWSMPISRLWMSIRRIRIIEHRNVPMRLFVREYVRAYA